MPRRGGTSGVRPSSGPAGHAPPHTLKRSKRPLYANVLAPEDAALYTHLAESSNGLVVLLPLLLWRRGLGRGGPLSKLPIVATCQRAAAAMDLDRWWRTTTSSPCPSPPKEERETAPRPVSTEMRVESSEDGHTPAEAGSGTGGVQEMCPGKFQRQHWFARSIAIVNPPQRL